MAPEKNGSGSGAGTSREEAPVKVPAKDPKEKEEKKDEDLVIPSAWGDLCSDCCRQEIRTSTSSMTSVPKPLKFLRPHYGTLKVYYETMKDSDLKRYLVDILSILALTMSAEGERITLLPVTQNHLLLGNISMMTTY